MTHPAAVPWLAHLRTDSRGLPVPWVNRWGPEDVARLRVEHDPWVRGPGIVLDDRDQAVPDFTAQSPQRQREATVRGLCQVCGRPVPWSRRRLVVSSVSVQTIDVPGLGRRGVVTEPWLDGRCAALAVRFCPALIRRQRDDDLHVVEVTGRQEVALVTSLATTDVADRDGPRAVPDSLPAALWVKIVLLKVGLVVCDA